MSTEFCLRLLDPATEQHLFHIAYNWRRPKRHTQPDRMPFEDFAAVSDTQLTVGLFNGELQAVYFLQEVEPGVYQAHFTSRKGTKVQLLLEGARQVAEAVLANGGSEIHAWVTPRNQPLRIFLTHLGFSETGRSTFNAGQNDTDGTRLPLDRCNQRREFVKYVLKADAIGTLRQETRVEAD